MIPNNGLTFGKNVCMCTMSCCVETVSVLNAHIIACVGFCHLCRFPSHDDYHIVCLALIKAYPFLEDKEQFGRRNCGRMVGMQLLLYICFACINFL